MKAVTDVEHEHHERISETLDRLPELANMLAQRPRPAAFDEGLATLVRFATETLTPHMEAVEANLYPELDRLMQKRHSMLQMRREHEDLRGLIKRLSSFLEAVEADALGPAGTIGLRRVLYRLYALMKVHLAEEEEYVRVLAHNLSDDQQAELAKGLDHAMAEPV